MDENQLERSIEAILFAAGEPVPAARIAVSLQCTEEEVHACAKRAACAGDDAHLQCWVAVEFIERSHHGFRHFQRGGVACLGAVQGHDLHVAAHFNQEGRGHRVSFGSRFAWPRTTAAVRCAGRASKNRRR